MRVYTHLYDGQKEEAAFDLADLIADEKARKDKRDAALRTVSWQREPVVAQLWHEADFGPGPVDSRKQKARTGRAFFWWIVWDLNLQPAD